MSNLEEFMKVVTTINESPIPLPPEALRNVYLGCMAKCVAQMADSLNEIKDAIKEKEDGNDN